MPKLKASEINKPKNFILDLLKDNSGVRVPITNPNNALWCWDNYFNTEPNYEQKRADILDAIKNERYYNTKTELPQVGQIMLGIGMVKKRVEYLLKEHGDEIDLNTVSHQSIRLRDDYFFKFLIDSGIDPNYIDKNGRSLMQSAITRGNSAIFKLLWDHPEINRGVKTRDGMNVAHLAVIYKIYPLFDIIIKKDISLFWEKNKLNKTSLDYLDEYNRSTGLFENHADLQYFKKVPTKLGYSIEKIAVEMFKNNILLTNQYKNPDLKYHLIYVYTDMLTKKTDVTDEKVSKKMKI